MGKLVITRRVGERVFVGPLAIISVISSGGGSASIEIVTHLNIILMPDMIPLHQPVSSPGRERPPVFLTINVEDTLALGSDIRIMLVSAKNDVVKLGFEAPKHVQILREEVYERIVNETREAANPVVVPELPESLRESIPKDSQPHRRLGIKRGNDESDPGK